MAHERLIWADSLKGILISLVVLGHAIQHTLGEGCYNDHLWNLIYSFHMAAFMAVSGYFAFRPKPSRGGQNCCSQIFRRFRQLIIPFFFWTVIMLIVENRLTLRGLTNSILYPDGGGLWFLWVLFFISVLFLLCSELAERTRIRQEVIIFSTCLMLVVLMVLFEIRVLGFQFIAYYLLFYSLGYYLHRYYDIILTNNKLVILILIFIWGVLAWFWQMHDLPEPLNRIPLPSSIIQYGYRFITAAIACYVLIAISPKVLNGASKVNMGLCNLGKVSLGIYTVHFILIGGIVNFYLDLGMKDPMVILVSFITGLLLSSIIVRLLSKWKITNTWLLGKV